MKIALALICAIAAIGTLGCKKKSYNNTYQLTENFCTTGEQTFHSKNDFCAGLQNEELNNHCAKKTRQDRFEAECSGSFFN